VWERERERERVGVFVCVFVCVGVGVCVCVWVGGLRQHVQQENHNGFEEQKHTTGVCICNNISKHLHRLASHRSKRWMDAGVKKNGGHFQNII
jgi:hypothetical protein